MPGRYFSNNAIPTKLTSPLTAVATSMDVQAITGFPTQYPYTLTIDKNNTVLADIVEVTGAATGTGPYTLPIRRNVDDAVASAHSVDALVSHDHTKRDYADLQTMEPRNARFARGFLFSGS